MTNFVMFTISLVLACFVGCFVGKTVGCLFEWAFGSVTVIKYKGKKVRVISKDEHLAPLVVAIIQELIKQRIEETDD